MKEMKKVIQIENKTKNGQVKPQDLNEWGYPQADKFTFAGCTTKRIAIPETETLVITHTNTWVKRKKEQAPAPVADETPTQRTVADLKEECRVLGLKVGGKKADLIARLDAHYADMRCDLCDDDTHVGFIDDAQTFKVCKYCDTDGSAFAPKEWPVEVLNEIGLDDNGDALRGEEE